MPASQVQPSIVGQPASDIEKRALDMEAGAQEDQTTIDAASTDGKRGEDDPDIEYDTKEKQYGVEKIRAITSAWTYRALIVTYLL